MSDYRELLIGCGGKREKDLRLPTAYELEWGRLNSGIKRGAEFKNLSTLDINPAHRPDWLCDLSRLDSDLSNEDWGRFVVTPKEGSEPPIRYDGGKATTLQSDYFNEIHAYEVLEHIGMQGDAETFFAQFTEFHRILRPGGLLFGTCPSWRSMWAWGDPSHTRVITSGTLVFLSQEQYERQVGVTPMSDFRHIYKADFETLYCVEDDVFLGFVLRAIK